MTKSENGRLSDRAGGNNAGARPCAGAPAARGVGRPWCDERASVTVVMLGVIGAVLVLTISGLLLASAVLSSHRARAAADLAALAAAAGLMRGDPITTACAKAAQVAAANHGRLQQCTVTAADIRLSVAVDLGAAGVGVATARSRAGPVPGPGVG